MEDVIARHVDMLVECGSTVTMDADRRVLIDAAIAIDGGRIVAIGDRADLRARYRPSRVLDARRDIVTPGMVNGHQHLTGDPLTRCCTPDDLPPGASVFAWSVPLHAAHEPDDDEIGATITALESLRNGVTMLVEAGTVAYPNRAAGGILATGARATIGTWGWDVDGVPYGGTVEEVLARQRDVLDRFPPGGLVTGWVTLVGHSLASDALMVGASEVARGYGVGMTMHMSPTSSDPEVFLERHGVRPLVHLDRLGVLGEHLLLAHGVWLDDEEIELLLATRTALAYCPWAYLRLGQGVVGQGRHAEIFRRGGRIALGCDASNASDGLDILQAAALAAGLAKDIAVDPTWFGAHDVFGWATSAGAEAIGMGNHIGSIEVGKAADLVVHDGRDFAFLADGDVALQLVWGTDGRSVRDVIVAGEIVLRDRRSTRVDEDALRSAARERSRHLMRRAGIDVPRRWPRGLAWDRDPDS